jgi:hypothetical protein|uniref:Uncharacterized protein n=1 Tax=viral metagenome TaxID=1070528 RepID=A0A6C0DS62_9ZZZZ
MEEKDTEIVKEEECIELKNIKYKTMLLNGNPIVETKSSNNLLNLDKFLEDEKNNSKNEPWSKLNKTIKTQKILSYVESYKNEKKLNEEEEKLLTAFLKDCLDKKRLTRVKDVIYDKVTGNIKEIPALFYNKSNKHFTLKNLDKRVSTLKSLPSNKHKKSVSNTSESNDNDD